MKQSIYISILAALFLAAACTDQPDIVIRPGQEMVLTARTEQPASKTVVTNETHVYWEPGDEIAVFSGDKSGKFTTDLSAASATATFKGSLYGDPEETLWAVYPYSDNATFDGESITTVLPSVQTARAGSFGKDMNLAVAQTTGSTLQFYNVGGGVRFSVKEEGIKKVVFEGLNGEILAGMVKIGFENSMPVVKEVTSGSQFLTLLPPEGETFQKDTWYYIVALPAALEKGYKLRFYKTDDYARRVSENAVTISRSLYGSVAGADEGLTYESTTMKNPETDEEINESINTTEEIISKLPAISSVFRNEDKDDFEALCSEIELIEGVKYVECNDSHTIVSIQQKDQIWINYFLSSAEDNISSFPADISTKSVFLKNGSMRSSTKSLTKKALLLAPLLSEKGWENQFIDLREILLHNMGYDVTIKSDKTDEKADYEAFTGRGLDGYDFIFITTHGGRVHKASSKKGEKVTAFMTATEYDSEWLKHHANALNTFAICTCEDEGNGKRYVCVTPDALDVGECNLEGAVVVCTACESLAIRNGSASMAQAFIDHGAKAFTGFTEEINRSVGSWMSLFFMRFLSEGISFQKAATYWSTSRLMKSACEALVSHWKKYKLYDEETYRSVNHRLFAIKLDKEDTDLYLCEASPSLSEPKMFDGRIKLSWISSLYSTTASIRWKDNDRNVIIYSGDSHFEVYYDVLIDGKGLISQKGIGYDYIPTSPGDHTWQIIAHFRDDDTGAIIESFPSEVGTFTVKEATYETPSLIDLGMPSGVKWASFNLGATKAEENGRQFAWGETTPKNEFGWSTYKWCKGSENTITKYCWDSSYGYNGFVDNKRQLDLSDDAANAQLKGEFRTPTCDDWKEMLEHTTHQWTNNYNGTGVAGLVCKSTVSGYTTKQIFLPAARYGSCGDYMTSSAVNTNPDGFDVVYFTENQLYGANYDNKCSAGSREEGYTIRPVYGQPVTPSVVHSVTVSPASYNFGSVVAGQQSDSKKFSITNGGSEDIEYWVESCPDGFAYPDGMKNKVRGKVSANSTLERFWVRFVPTQAKNYSGTVVLGTTDSEYPYLYISVSGKGTN